MAYHVSFFSSKGGQGKTTLAVNYALYTESIYYTNDFKSGTKNIYSELFPKNSFKLISEDITDIELEDKTNVVFDFGGYIDKMIPSILSASDLCVIPIMYQSNADLEAFSLIIDSISKINENIIIVINNTESHYIEQLYLGLSERYPFNIFIVKRSMYLTYLANEGKTPFNINATGITKHALNQLQEQLKLLFDSIRTF
jgi:cellulose biosynthesis protein BcsQ